MEPAEKMSTPMILSLAAGDAPANTGPAVAGDGRRQHAALFEERRDQSESLSAMFRAFAHREDMRIGRLHVVVDDDPAAHFETRALRPDPHWAGCRRRSPPGRPPALRPTRSAGHPPARCRTTPPSVAGASRGCPGFRSCASGTRRRSHPAGAPSACPSGEPRSLRSRAPAGRERLPSPRSPPPITAVFKPGTRFFQQSPRVVQRAEHVHVSSCPRRESAG